MKKGNKENSNVIVIKRNSFSRVTERGDSANPNNATTSNTASANPNQRTSSISRIFGTDISNLTNGAPLQTPGSQI
jgi:hypothetical protein